MATRHKGKIPSELSTEELIQKVCADFAEKIEISMEKKFSRVHVRLDELNKSISQLNGYVDTNKTNIALLSDKIDTLEQSARINNLRIHGLPEEKENESVIDNVLNLFVAKLGVACSSDDINNAYRLGRLSNDVEEPRTVLVNFIRQTKRGEVLKAKSKLRNNSISVFEDLSKQRYKLLKAAKEKVGSKKAWSANGNIYIWLEDEKKRRLVTREDDL